MSAMLNRPSRILLPIYKASSDGFFYPRYPHGDKPPSQASIRQIAVYDPAPAHIGGVAGGPAYRFMTAFPTATLPGSTIVVFGTLSNFAGNFITGASDPVNGTYTNLDNISGGTGTGLQNVASMYFPNAAAIPAGATGTATGGTATSITDSSKSWTPNQWVGATALNLTRNQSTIVTSNTATTLTFASGGTTASGDVYAVGGHVDILLNAFDDFNASVIVEVTGVQASSLAGHHAAIVHTAGAAIDNVSSGAAPLGSSPVLMLAFGYNVTNDSTFTTNAGSAFTSDGSMWQWDYGAGNQVARLEHLRIQDPGSMDAKVSATGADYYACFYVALLERPT
jgi:hypothetical protein